MLSLASLAASKKKGRGDRGPTLCYGVGYGQACGPGAAFDGHTLPIVALQTKP